MSFCFAPGWSQPWWGPRKMREAGVMAGPGVTFPFFPHCPDQFGLSEALLSPRGQ